jgi:hypothetical protein
LECGSSLPLSTCLYGSKNLMTFCAPAVPTAEPQVRSPLLSRAGSLENGRAHAPRQKAPCIDHCYLSQ